MALGGLLFSVTLAYLNDIIIPSKDLTEKISKLILVLEALENAGLTNRLEKCRFFMRRLDYLGFEISSDGIEPGKRKVLAVKDFRFYTEKRKSRKRFYRSNKFFSLFYKKFSCHSMTNYGLT